MPIIPWVYDEVDLSHSQNLECHYHEIHFHQEFPLQVVILSFYPVTREAHNLIISQVQPVRKSYSIILLKFELMCKKSPCYKFRGWRKTQKAKGRSNLDVVIQNECKEILKMNIYIFVCVTHIQIIHACQYTYIYVCAFESINLYTYTFIYACVCAETLYKYICYNIHKSKQCGLKFAQKHMWDLIWNKP